MMDGTSPMRQATIAAMTVAAARDPQKARLLAVELGSLPYDRRTDSGLFTLAEQVGVPTGRLEQLAQLDPSRILEHATTICVDCRDTHSVDAGAGRFVRCPNCNPEPPPEEDT